MFGWWEIMDFWNLYSWNAHSVYVFSLETFCKFGSMGGTTRFGPEESSTKFRSTGQFHNLGQLNVDFRLLWAGKIGGPGQVCVWNPWLCLNHTGYALESSWVWIRQMAHNQAHQCWATCTVGSGPYEAKNHP